MKVGVGYQNEQNATLSARLCAQEALIQGGIDRPDLVLAFCNGALDADEFFRGLQSVLGTETRIIGGEAIGIITNTEFSYNGYPAGVAIFQSDSLDVRIASAGELDQDTEAAGRRLATQLARQPDDKILLMFYDSIKTPATETSPPVINASQPLLKGIESVLSSDIPIVGGGVMADFEFSPTRQFCGTHVDSQNVVGALVSGDFTPYFQIMHGCALMDGIYHTITKMDGATLFEVDGRPIVETIDKMYGNLEWRQQMPVKRLTIGVNMGEKFAPFDESQYVNRLITGILPNEEGVVIFESDLEPGTEIQFMLRDQREILESVEKNTAEVMERIAADGKTPIFGFYIDCAGRSARWSETTTEEAEEVMRIFKRDNVPLFGFYSGVEVAPFIGQNRGLDWTGVLVVMTEG